MEKKLNIFHFFFLEKLCEKLLVYTLFIPLGDADKVVMTMPAPDNKLILTYSNTAYGDSVVECNCADSTTFKFKSSTPGGQNVSDF